jgi:hypothetical protein
MNAEVGAGVPQFTVSPRQEQNFSSFIGWIDTKSGLTGVEAFKRSYQGLFASMKKNNYEEFIKWSRKLSAEAKRFSDAQKSTILAFFETIRVPNPAPLKPPPPNACEVSCLFGSCLITCTEGTEPKCRCEWYGAPDSSCEPNGASQE